ncbi:hypothetical protein F4821DRAFT_257099 [Hypoxylon rubiginosum]|uniref:Uncharacterized protein n=1 Tax=Hypoxylon rubiginosum TaxID=110542 RepID=A0ACC0DA96_9PEZI|nr:hypothetical protein F4821DRAFT_257099 [Hypoxylon rubiginosum]
MGNIFGKPQTFYVSYDWDNPSEPYIDTDPSSCSSSSSCSCSSSNSCPCPCPCPCSCSDDSLAPNNRPHLFMSLLCCPWYGNTLVVDESSEDEDEDEDSGWDGAVVGIRIRDHWALAFRSGVDVYQLPRRINGFRTRVPRQCRRTCGRRRVVYIIGDDSSSSEEDASEVTAEVVLVN